MNHGFKLLIELVPAGAWNLSVYQLLKKRKQLHKWRKLKEELVKKEGRRCWICDTEGGRLEAHEFWEYDDATHVQKLAAIHHICSLCHKIKHIGFWCHTTDGKRSLAKTGLTKAVLLQHFCKVNGCSLAEFEAHERHAFSVWRERSTHEWIQDFGDYTSVLS